MKLAFLVAVSLLDKLFLNFSLQKQQPQEQKSPSSFQNVKVLTWNLLAPCYTDALYKHRSNRRSRPPEQNGEHDDTHNSIFFDKNGVNVLDWSYRKPRILRVLKDSKADVIFLQEVQLSYWEDNDDDDESPLAEAFRSMGYTNAYVQNVKGQHPVGNVILLSDDFLSPSSSKSSNNDTGEGWTVKRVESRSRVLLLQLQRKTSMQDAESDPAPQSLFLLNVHLQASRDDESTRFCQVRSLLKRLNTHSMSTSSTRATAKEKSNDMVVMMGDFNMLRDGAVYHLLATGELPEGDELTQVKKQASTAFLPLRDVYAPPHCQGNDSRYMDCIISEYEYSKELLSNESPNNEDEDDKSGSASSEFPRWTYAGWSVLDYIFVSNRYIEFVEPWWGSRISPALRKEEPIYYDDGDEKKEKKAFRPPWLASRDYPHAHLPSDHRPIGAHLRIRNNR